jgi:hypothetical protein
MSPQQQLIPDRHDASTTDDRSTNDETPASPPFPYGKLDAAAVSQQDADVTASIAPTVGGPDACPDCGGATTNAQGVLDCADCDWAGRK